MMMIFFMVPDLYIFVGRVQIAVGKYIGVEAGSRDMIGSAPLNEFSDRSSRNNPHPSIPQFPPSQYNDRDTL